MLKEQAYGVVTHPPKSIIVRLPTSPESCHVVSDFCRKDDFERPPGRWLAGSKRACSGVANPVGGTALGNKRSEPLEARQSPG